MEEDGVIAQAARNTTPSEPVGAIARAADPERHIVPGEIERSLTEGLPWERTKERIKEVGGDPSKYEHLKPMADLAEAKKKAGSSGVSVSQSFRKSFMGFSDLTSLNSLPDVPSGASVLGAKLFGGRVVGTKEYADAVTKYKGGDYTPDDLEAIAQYERHNEIDAAVKKQASYGQRLFLEIGGLAKIAQEGVVGGAVLGTGARMLGIGRAGAVGAAGAAAGMAPAIPQVGTTAGQLATVATTKLAQTAAMPSMYVPIAQQINQREGRDPNSWKGFPTAFGYGYANTLVMGQFQKGLQGNVLSDAFKKGVLGYAELQGVDVAAGVADQFLSKSYQIKADDDRFGSLGQWLRAYRAGDKDKASEVLRDASLGVLSFGAFAAMHGREKVADDLTKSYMDTVTKMRDAGKSKREAAAIVAALHDKLEEGLSANPWLDRTQAAEYLKVSETKETEGYIKKLVEVFEPKPPQAITINDVPAASGTPVDPASGNVATAPATAAPGSQPASASGAAGLAGPTATPEAAAKAPETVAPPPAPATIPRAPEPGVKPIEVRKDGTAIYDPKDVPQDIHNAAAETAETAYEASKAKKGSSEGRAASAGHKTYLATVASLMAARQKVATVATPPEAPSTPPVAPESQIGNTPTTPIESPPEPTSQGKLARQASLDRLKALQEGRTPEPVPPVATVATPEAAPEVTLHPDAVVNLARRTLVENRNGLSEKQRTEYRESFEKSVAALSPVARARVNATVKAVAFHDTPYAAGIANAREWATNPEVTPAQREYWEKRLKALEKFESFAVGAFNLKTGTLHLDGQFASERGKGYDFGDAEGILRRERIYKHELGHALDGPDFVHSKPGGQGWYNVHMGEFGPLAKRKAGYVHLTNYANESSSESLAEFNRVLHDESIPTSQIARDFPKASAYFKKQGWWPEERGSAEPPVAPTKAAEVFTERLGPADEHVDVSVPEVATVATSEIKPLSAPELNRRPNADREYVESHRDIAPKESHELFDSALHNMADRETDARYAAEEGKFYPSEGHARRADTITQLEAVLRAAVKRNLPGTEYIERTIAGLRSIAEPEGKYGPLHIDRTEEMRREPLVATVATPKVGARKTTEPAKEGLSNLQSGKKFAPPAPPPAKKLAGKRVVREAPVTEESRLEAERLAKVDTAKAESQGAPDASQLDAESLGVGEVKRADLSSIHGVIEFVNASDKLSTSEQKYLTARVAGETTATIAKRFSVSKQNVEQISDKALKKLGFDNFDDIMLGIKGRGRVFEHIDAEAHRNAEGAKTDTSVTDLFHRSVGSGEGELRFPLKTTILDALFGKAGIGQRSRSDRVKSLFFGNLPEVATVAKEQEMDARIAQYAFDVRNGDKDLRAALQESGIRYEQLDKAALTQLDSVLRGEKPARAGVHPKVLAALDAMRSQVDNLSDALISVGAIYGPMVATVASNMGTYLTRQFEVFRNPEWFREVEAPIVNRFKAWLTNELLNARGIAPTAEEVAAITTSLLVDGKAADNPLAFIRKSKLGSQDLSILTKRQDIPPELRALWGEIEDPLVNYTNSVAKMAHLLASHQFLNRVAAEGLGKFLFKSTDLEAFQREHPNSAAVKIADKDSLVMGPLAGLYTTPEIKAAFENVFQKQDLPAGMQWYMKALAMAKFSKTVLSHTGQIRNFLSNIGSVAANGHWRVDKMPEAFHAILSDTPAARDYWRKLVGMGVVEDGLSYQDFKRTVDDAFQDKKPTTNVTGSPLIDGVLAKMWKVGSEFATKTYKYGDAVWKVYAFESEAKRYESAGLSRAQAEVKAAQIVRDTMPTYSKLPEIVQKLRRAPFVAPFISFQAEMIRTTKNTLKLAIAELKDPATKHIGAQRLAGLTASMVLPWALAAATRAMFGVSQDEEDAMRRFMPDYQKQSRLGFVGRDEKGMAKYIDVSKTDPHSYISDGLLAAFRGKDLGEGVKDAMGEWAKPFVQEELLLRPILDIARNQKEPGGQVYNPSDSTANQIGDVATVATKPFVPAGASAVRRLWMAASGTPEQQSGKKYELTDTAQEQISGQRLESIDLSAQLASKAKGFKAAESDSARLTQSLIHARGDVSQDQLKDARDRTVAGRQAALEDMKRDVEAAMKLGMTKGQIARVLVDAGVSAQDIGALFTGQQMPYLPSLQGSQEERIRAGAVRKFAGSSSAP